MFALLMNPIYQFAAVCGNKSTFLGFPTWYKYLHTENLAGQCTVDFSFPGDISKILLAVVEIMLRIGALIAVGFVIYGGYRYILSQGNSDQQSAARDTIINAVIGLVITILATGIVTFVFRNLAQ